MANYPPPPPAYGGGYSVPAGPPAAPPSILTAVKLMYAGAGLSALSLIAGVLSKSAIKTAVEKAQPTFTAQQVDTAVNVGLATAVVIGLIGVGLWLWMAYANKAGKSWARIVASILFGLNALSMIYSLISAGTPVAGKLLSVLIFLVGLGAVIFLWKPESTAFFEAPRY